MPFSVDVKSYEQTRYAPLRAHMDEVCGTLFDHEALVRENAATGGDLKGSGSGE